MARTRDLIQAALTRGLNLVRRPSMLSRGQCSAADNVIFTQRSVKRRPGKLVAYERPITSATPVDLIKKFYKLDSNGDMTKFFIMTHGAKMWFVPDATDAWSDDDETAVEGSDGATKYTEIGLPNNADDTMYEGYSSSPSTIAINPGPGGFIDHAFQSKNWLYIHPTPQSGDTRVQNVPMRTACTTNTDGEAYLHGLVPPRDLDQDDSDHSDAPSNFDTENFDQDGSTLYEHMVLDSSGNPHIAYVHDNDIYHATKVTLGWAKQQVGTPVGTPRYSSVGVGSDGVIHIAWIDDLTGTYDVKYLASDSSGDFTAGAGTTIITVTGSIPTDSFGCQISVDSNDEPHVIYYNATAGQTDLRYTNNKGWFGNWTSPQDVDTTSSLPIGLYASMAIDSSGAPHVCYTSGDSIGSDWVLYYSKRTSGVWSTPVSVDATANTGELCAIALTSEGIPAVLYFDNGNDDVLFQLANDVDGLTWGGEVTVDASADLSLSNSQRTALAFDSDDNPTAIYTLGGGAGTKIARSVDGGATWGTPGTVDATGGIQVSAAYDSSDALHFVWNDNYVTATVADYYYRLTAEYDDGILGESGPSDAVVTSIGHIIDADNTQILTLATTTQAAHYDMTREVSKIFVYRTIEGGPSDGTYYRVGSVTCTNGVVQGEFTDNVPDSELVDPTNPILDEDKFLPPKYKHAVYWKDRAVIGNLKVRDTAASEGEELDLEDGGIHRNRIRFSRGFKPDIFPANYFIDILPDGESGEITGLIVSPRIDALLVFMQADTVAITGDSPLGERGTVFRPRNIAQSKGTPSPDSIIEANGLIFYWTREGIEVINGYTARNITSETIGPLWNDIEGDHADRIDMTNLDLVKSAFDAKTNTVYWAYPGAVDSPGYNNKILALHLDRWQESGFGDGVFSIYSGWRVSSFSVWDGEGDRGEIFGGEAHGTRNPVTYRLNISNEDHNSADGDPINHTFSAIVATFKPRLEDGNRPDMLKRWHSAVIRQRSGANAATINVVPDEQSAIALVSSYDLDTNDLTGTLRLPIPRRVNAYNAGLEFTVTDSVPVSDGPVPWELFMVGYEVSSLPTKVRPVA